MPRQRHRKRRYRSLLIGGYIAGRMRAPREGADETETEFRDGLHGALVWGISILFGAILAFHAASATAQTGAVAFDKGAIYTVAADTLFAPATVADATPTAPSPPPAPAKSSSIVAPSISAKGADENIGAERVIATAVAAGHLSAAQRGYLTASYRRGLA